MGGGTSKSAPIFEQEPHRPILRQESCPLIRFVLQACNELMGGKGSNYWSYNSSTKKCQKHNGGNTGTANQFASKALCSVACETPIPVRYCLQMFKMHRRTAKHRSSWTALVGLRRVLVSGIGIDAECICLFTTSGPIVPCQSLPVLSI